MDEIDELKRLYYQLEKTKLPPFTGNDKLDDWIENLIEIDTFLAGMACSAIGGGVILKRDLVRLNQLNQNLHDLLKEDEFDKIVIEQCLNYSQLLIDIYSILLIIAR